MVGSLSASRSTTSRWAASRCRSQHDSIAQNGSGRACSSALTPTDSTSAGRIGDATDSTSSRTRASGVSPSALWAVFTCSSAGFGCSAAIRSSSPGTSSFGDGLHAAPDPHQRSHRLPQRQRGVVGHLQNGLDARGPSGNHHAGDDAIDGNGDRDRAVAEQVVHGAGGRLDTLEGEHGAPCPRTGAADSLGRRRRRCRHRIAFP